LFTFNSDKHSETFCTGNTVKFATVLSDRVRYFKYHSDFKLFNVKLLNADINM